ncbi:MAG TPA: hypothetical protein VFM09_06905 [Marmoricola sp.]|nr:hypothetical protein [Marmoricola sp.]
MTAVEALIWFVCMTTAVFLTIAVGVFLAARSGNPHVQREHAWAHTLAHPRLHRPTLRPRRH